MIDKSLSQEIKNLILQETIWGRHYLGKVVEIVDPLQKGRILVIVPFLGLNTPDAGLWCSPRMEHGISTPNVADWVEVYFINWNRNLPVYLTIASEMAEMLPKNYDGVPTTHILWESIDGSAYLKYDSLTKILNFISTEIDINGNGHNLIMGDLLQTLMNTLLSNLHIFLGTGMAGSTPVVFSGSFPTLDLTNAETTTLKSGG